MRSPPLVAAVAAVLALMAVAATLAASNAGAPAGCRWAWRVDRDSPGPVLLDVVAVSATEAWAVGATGRGQSEATDRPAILRWDGRRWATSPSGVDVHGVLQAVDASGPTDVWAVGETRDGELVLHWDGREWKRVAAPHHENASGFSAVAAVSSDDVWLGRRNPGRSFEDVAPAFEHWNGRGWTAWYEDDVVSISDFAVLSSTDIWAVGESGAISLSEIDPVVLRWDGSRWAASPARSAAGYDSFSAVEARKPNEAWAVGTTVQRWDGRAWRVQARTPRNGVAVADRGRVHAVASLSKDGIEHPLVAEWAGRRWSTAALAVRGRLDAVTRAPGVGLFAVGGARPGPDGTTRTLIARFSCR